MKINLLPLAIVVSVAAFCVIYFAWIANAGQTSSGLDRDRVVVPNSADGLTEKEINEAYGQIEMGFEENKGQTDPSVGFLARGSGYTLFLKPDEAVFALSENRGDDRTTDVSADRTRSDGGDPKPPYGLSNVTSVLRMQLVGGNRAAEAAGADELVGKANYFIGNDPAEWRTNVSTYRRVRYPEVYKGVDVEYYGNQRQLEYDFRIAPGADYRQISLMFAGADSVKVEPGTGDLLIAVNDHTVRQHKPVVYQESDGERREIEGRFSTLRGGRVGFDIGDYDDSRPLIIDPVLVYSTYLGGSGDESAYAVAVDSAGNAYVTGDTTSANFPLTNPIQGTIGGGFDDVFVTKINPAGTAIVYSTYLGGGDSDYGLGIATDPSGNAYITGNTLSTNFPTANPIQAAHGAGSGYDAFVTKINPNGSGLVYSTFLGGSNLDTGGGIAADASGNAYVIGSSQSNDFPTTPNAFGRTLGAAGRDAFVTKINSGGSAFVYSTYLGGASDDGGNGIASDSTGNAYVTGFTSSTNFPTVNPIQGTIGLGQYDAFVSKINPDGSALVYSTYLGGNSADLGRGIAVDSAGNAYVTGETGSVAFPVVNPIQGIHAGDASIPDAFITKFNAAGSAIVYSTYLGGDGTDVAYGITTDTAGNAYICGRTSSTNFPTASPVQGTRDGGSDAFVAKINSAGSALAYSTYLGGTADDSGYGIAVDPNGNSYVTGQTESTNYPVAGPIQGSRSGFSDMFLSKIADIPAPTPTPTPIPTPTPTATPTPTPAPTPISASPGDLVISQVYGGGGTTGATYRNSYVEIFNRNRAPVLTHAYAIALGLGTSPIDRSFGTSSSRGIVIQPGQHLLIRMGSGGNNGADLPQPDLDVQPPPNFPSAFFGLSGKLALTGETADNSIFADCPLAAQSLLDFVGFGATNCFEGSGPIVDLSVTTAALRKSNGCTDTGDNANDFTIGTPNPRNSGSPFNTCATPTPTPTPTPVPTPSAKSRADFDGDGKTDFSVFRPSDGNWYALKSGGGVKIDNWGAATDTAVPGDYDNDGKADVAVYRPSTGQWFILKSADSTVSVIGWGASTDRPVAADYDGDGKTDVAVYRPSDGNWYALLSSGSVSITNWGSSTDVPVPADYDGDGKTDVAVFRPSTGQWFVLRSTGGVLATGWGVPGDKPIEADYDGDNKDDVAVYRPSDGNWYILRSSDGAVMIVNWGNSTDVPVPGDYDGDGTDDVAVYRNGVWYVLESSAGLQIANWGLAGDIPIPAKYIP